MIEELDDAALMHSIALGNTDAFRVLMNRHEKAVFNYFLRSTGSIEDAEDLTQQLFVNLYRSSSRYRKTASFRTFLYRIAFNLAVSFSRKRKAKGTVSLEQALDFGGDRTTRKVMKSDPEEYMEVSELHGAYKEALSRLPVEWRTAIELRVGEEFSYKEITKIMGKSVSAVESILFRARERLASELERFRKEEKM